ncbi:MAG: histidinol-phosphate transaminase [Persicimonas sp.]
MSQLDCKVRAERPGPSSDPSPSLREIVGRRSIDVAPSVAELTPYEAVTSQAAIEAAPDGQTTFKLDWNEATIAPSPRVTAAIQEYLQGDRSLNWYPQLGSRQLLEALEDYTGLESDQMLVTNGSDDALQLICNTFLSEGDRVVAPVPSYNHFLVFAQSCGARIEEVCGPTPFAKNLAGIDEAMTRDTRILYLVSPNNPTGVLLDPSDVDALCAAYPDTLVILDEAYYEFAGVTGIDLVDRHPNLIVTRTFSKAFGLAGLRVGYLAADEELVEGLSRIYNPKSVNALAQVGAMAALDDLEYLNGFLEEVDTSKELLADFFEERGVDYHVSPANFVIVRVPRIGETLEELEERRIFVRDRSNYPGLEGCLRMSVGTVEQTERLIEHLDEVF